MAEYVALYRKWRPSVFADVIGQEHITKVLCSEVSGGSVSHAYLFCGSRGTGKTTCAKILAKAVNCENPQNGDPCGQCRTCLAFDKTYDVLEIDAASNNSVENIRDLCEKVGFMPIEMKKRVYIIDEVHMLSSGAFNALLKTLEEPPSHVMFILATTELNKIPATILSRCKRFDFHRISPEDMLPRLRYISESEQIGITDDALRLIAFLATGAMRDALSMLELFVGQTGIDRDKAAAALGVVGNAPVLALLGAIAESKTDKALMALDTVYRASKDMGVLCSELAEMFRNLLIVKYASNSVSKLIEADPDVIVSLRNCEEYFTKERLLYSLEITEQTQSRLAYSGLSRRTLAELMIVRLCDARLSTSSDALLSRVASLEAKLAGGTVMLAQTPSAQNAAQPEQNAPTSEVAVDTGAALDDEIPLPEAPPEQEEYAEPEYRSKPTAKAPQTPKAPASLKKEEARAVPEEKGVEMMAFAELLDAVKAQDAMLYSMLNGAYAEVFPDKLKIHLSPIGYLMLAEDKEKTALIEQLATGLLGMKVRVVYERTVTKVAGTRPDLNEL